MSLDRASTGTVRSGNTWWWTLAVTLVVVTGLTMVGPFENSAWERPGLLFGLVTVSAAACVIAATLVVALADRVGMAEIGLLGTALLVASVLPMVHGLTVPGVLYDANEAFRTSTFFSLPVAAAAALPLLIPNSRFGRWAARDWRNWTMLAMVGAFALASIVVFKPDVISSPGPRHPFTICLTLVMMVALGSMSRRQLRLYELGGQVPNLVASVSLLALAVTALLPVVESAYGATFWWLHVTGALGVLGACVGVGVSKRMSSSAQDILAPILTRDPLVAFELGVSPTVHRFVADLEMKDEITRDHVVRTGELALRVGERMGLSPRDLRNLGLAAMLHDVGKLRTPDEILKKPASLTPDEYEVIKRHTVHGEEMLAVEPALAQAALIVRSHHERVDGDGYPDGLRGPEIPLAARIIAACDAVDAMTHDRPYRRALPVPLAFAILREHSGSQWDPSVVRAVIETYPTMPTVSALDAVGRDVGDIELPADVSEILTTVDAEI